MKQDTASSWKNEILVCKSLFEKKFKDYGTAWRIMRLPSITDQIFIKANRIRSVQESGEQKVKDDVQSDFIGIVNYSVMAIMQIKLSNSQKLELSWTEIDPLYDSIVNETFDLLMNKNHDYGEAWRDMRISSITDIILMKILRVKQIEDNKGKTLVSEGIDANYQDMINYAVFCLIKMKEDENIARV